jgi:hypothetical protein
LIVPGAASAAPASLVEASDAGVAGPDEEEEHPKPKSDAKEVNDARERDARRSEDGFIVRFL